MPLGYSLTLNPYYANNLYNIICIILNIIYTLLWTTKENWFLIYKMSLYSEIIQSALKTGSTADSCTHFIL